MNFVRYFIITNSMTRGQTQFVQSDVGNSHFSKVLNALKKYYNPALKILLSVCYFTVLWGLTK